MDIMKPSCQSSMGKRMNWGALPVGSLIYRSRFLFKAFLCLAAQRGSIRLMDTPMLVDTYTISRWKWTSVETFSLSGEPASASNFSHIYQLMAMNTERTAPRRTRLFHSSSSPTINRVGCSARPPKGFWISLRPKRLRRTSTSIASLRR